MDFLSKLAVMALDLPFRPIGNQVGLNPRNQSIPPTVYQTWENKSFGRRHILSMKKFRGLNSNLNFVLYDKTEREAYMKEHWGGREIHEIYRRATFGPLKADIFRYCIIFEKGGYYFDISKGVNSALTSMHSADAKGLLSFEKNKLHGSPGPDNVLMPLNLVVQWGFGFAPNHKLLIRHIENMELNFPRYVGRRFESPKSAILDFSGPRAFTRTVHEFARNEGLEGIDQLPEDFGSRGIYSMRGSSSRFLANPSYAKVRNAAIFH